MPAFCEGCVLSGRGLCDELITRPEESYRLWCVVVCDCQAWIMRPWPTRDCCFHVALSAAEFIYRRLISGKISVNDLGQS